MIPAAKILIIGAGGLGCATLMALMHAPRPSGIGEITLADPDRVELSNLHRQILYTLDDLGHRKATRAGLAVNEARGDIPIVPLIRRLDGKEEIKAAATACDLMVDGSDNFDTRFAANDAALELAIPLVHGAVIGLTGQLMTIIPGGSACLRCLFDGPPPDDAIATCRAQGVLGPLVGEVGWLMALEVMKWIRGEGTLLTDRLLTLDAGRQRRRTVPLAGRRRNCPGCGHLFDPKPKR